MHMRSKVHFPFRKFYGNVLKTDVRKIVLHCYYYLNDRVTYERESTLAS
jgi:hypothetical protein